MKPTQSAAPGPCSYIGQADLAEHLKGLLPGDTQFLTPSDIADWDLDGPWGNVLILDARDLSASWLNHVIAKMAQLPGTAVVGIGHNHASLADAVPADQITPWSIGHLLGIANEARQSQISGQRRDQDPLTGVMRRSVIQRELGLLLTEHVDAEQPMAYLMIDLSGLKRVNLRRGEQTGDRYLQAVAQRLRSTLRLRDTLARIDGSVFAALCRQIRNPMNVFDLVQKVQNALNEVIYELDAQALLTYSVGVAVYPDQGLKVAEMARSAELAMMRAKRSGPNEVRYFTRSMSSRLRRTQFVADQLRNAIAAEHLELRYAPQLQAVDGRCTGIAASIQWIDPDRGQQDALEWMQAAREADLMSEISLWAIQEMAQCALLPETEGLRIWIDLDVELLGRGDFEQALFRHLIEADLAPSRIGFELAEQQLNTLGLSSRPALNKCFDAGIGLVADHFAEDVVNLNLLNRLPLQAVKLSGDIVAAVGGGEELALSAVMGICRSFSLEVWAEDVNSLHQKDRLVELGVSRMQGRLSGADFSLSGLQAWLAEQSVQEPLPSA